MREGPGGEGSRCVDCCDARDEGLQGWGAGRGGGGGGGGEEEETGGGLAGGLMGERGVGTRLLALLAWFHYAMGGWERLVGEAEVESGSDAGGSLDHR